MTTTTTRVALLSSAAIAAACIALPGTAQAQATTCSQTGTTITCVDGTVTVLTATTTPATTTVAGPGLVTTAATGPSTTTYTATGPIATTAVRAVSLTSTGGALSFTPATGAPVNISTTGGSFAEGVLLNTTGQAATVTVGNISTTGTSSFGVRSNGGTDLTLRTGDITTTGATSRGIQASSQTGVVNITAGNVMTTDRGISTFTTGDATIVAGNVSAGAAGVLATTNNNGSITTGNVNITTGNVSAANGFGVIGQTIGTSGNVVVRTGTITNTGNSGVGGSAFNTVGSVDVGGCSSVTTTSANNAAVFAFNNGTGSLTINCGAVTSSGNNAVFAQSDGTPNGGNIAITTTSATSSNNPFSTVFAQTRGTGTITVNAGTVVNGTNLVNAGGAGIDLRTDTGAIDVGYGNVTTVGTSLLTNSTGTQNFRGAGSTLLSTGAGTVAARLTAAGVTGNLGNVTTTGLGSQGAIITSTAPVVLTVGNVATTGNGLTVNAGTNAVTLTTGTVTATEAGATGTVINATGPVTFTGGRQTANGANALQINGGAGAINASVAGAATTGTGTAVAITGTGPLTFANTGSISTSGADSTGLRITGVTTAAVNCGNISTAGANSPAVVVAANGTTSVTCGTVSTTGANSDAITVSNTAGTTTVTGGTTSATGTGSRGIIVTSSAPTNGLVTVNTGVVLASGNAVEATSAGTSGVVVNVAGNAGGGVAVQSLNGAGVTVTTAGGPATVTQSVGSTITAATDAIRVNNTVGGAITVNALGTLVANNGSGVFVSTNAASADPINVTTNVIRSTGGPGTWGSQVRASAGTGDITITSNGTIGSAGAPGSIFGGILAVTNGTSNRNVTVNVNANIGSPTDSSSASQVLISGTSSSARTLAVNIANASIFGGPGAVQVQQSATSLGDIRIIGTGTGTLSANGPAGIGINARILNAANPGNILVDVTQNVIGTVQGINATTLGTGSVTVAARGNVTATTGTGITAASGGTTLVTIGAGTTTSGVQGASLQGAAGNTLIVNGTLRNTAGTTPYTVLAGGPFTLTLGSAGTIVGPLAFTTGNDTFNNQGTFALPASLDFLAGTDVFNNSGTLNAFNGTSVVSNLETFNNVGGLIDLRDGAANDVVNLTNSNYAATGNARLGIDATGAGGVNAADRLVIGGTTTGTTTVLANIVAPVIDTTGALVIDSTLNNVAAGQFVLSGTNNFGLINYSLQTRSGDVFLVATPDARAYDAVFVGRQVRDLWYQSADVYTAYATARRVSFGQERKAPIGFWAQLYTDREKTGDRNSTTTLFGTSLAVSDRIRTDYRGAQGGIDFGSANFVVGVTGGYARAKGDSNFASDLRTEGHNYGAYAQFGMTSGLYAGALIKRDDYKTRLRNGAVQAGPARSRSRSDGVEGEIGLRTGGAGTVNFDFGAGLAYVRSKLDTFDFGNITFDGDKMTSMRGRVHARASFAGEMAPFVEVRGFHEFRGDNDFQLRSGLASTDLQGSGKGSWVRLEGGIGGGTGGGPLISGWADFGDTRGYGIRAGFRF